MKYMIDTRTIPKGKPSEEQIRKNEWKFREMNLMGLLMGYDDGQAHYKNIPLTQFKSKEELGDAIYTASMLLIEYKPVPEPMRTKLILEAENFRKHGRESLVE